MIAKILLTVDGKSYKPGEKIDKQLREVDKKFLVSEGYIAEEEKNVSKSKKAVEITKEGSEKSSNVDIKGD